MADKQAKTKAYCMQCGNTGRLLGGELCECRRDGRAKLETFVGESLQFIPKDYIGLGFDATFMPDTNNNYNAFMTSLYQDICRDLSLKKTYYINSPRRRSKTVFTYSAIQYLAKFQIPVFPYIDIAEAGRFIRDIDHGRTPEYLAKLNISSEAMYDVPVLFLKSVLNATQEMLTYTALLLDRRSRRGNNTIIFSHVPWSTFRRYDFNGAVGSLVGDGTFNTVLIKSWEEKGDKGDNAHG